MKAFYSILILSFLLAGCSQTNVKEDDSLKTHFDAAGLTGDFGMFDNGHGNFIIYNLRRFRDSAYQPSSTFDILLSLVGIQTGVVKDDSTVVSNLTLQQAFRSSCIGAFQDLSRRIGRDTLKRWIDTLGYGNKDMESPVDTFWLDNHLTVTSDEQLGLVKKLYFDQLPFFPRSQKVVRQMMLMESNANYRLSYKTGTGIRRDGHAIGWIIGWIEENKNLYFFVLNVDAADTGKDLKASGLDVLKHILGQLGFLQGKK